MCHNLPLRSLRKHQAGATLFVAMIFLLIFGGLAAAAMSGALSSARAIGNMQWRNEAIAAANAVLAQIVSGTRFAENPAGLRTEMNASINSSSHAVDLAGDGTEIPVTFDFNGDGIGDVRVSMPPTQIDGSTVAGPRCVRTRQILIASLTPTSAADVGCFGAGGSEPGIGSINSAGDYETVAPRQSFCSNTEWAIPVRATDPVTGTSVDVMQGVNVRVPRSDALNSCD